MKYAPRRESASTRRTKSSRATELGIAGHQAAMDALGSAAGWKREGNSAMWQQFGKKPDGKIRVPLRIDGYHPGIFTPGKGHVREKDK